MANRWGNNWNSDRLYFLGLQDHCSWWLQPWRHKRRLLLGRKSRTNNLGSILKNRDITLQTKDCLVKAMVFPVVMYRCESWTIKKTEHWRIDAFELWCRRLESPLDCKEIKPVNSKGNQSWIFLGKTDAEAEAPTFGHLMWRVDSLEKTLSWERLKLQHQSFQWIFRIEFL